MMKMIMIMMMMMMDDILPKGFFFFFFFFYGQRFTAQRLACSLTFSLLLHISYIHTYI